MQKKRVSFFVTVITSDAEKKFDKKTSLNKLVSSSKSKAKPVHFIDVQQIRSAFSDKQLVGSNSVINIQFQRCNAFIVF